MDEQYFREHLSAYIDNELTPEERAMMDQHLADNPESRRLLEKMRGLDRLVEEHGELGGGDYWERSAQKIEERLGIAETEVTELRSAPAIRTGTFWKWVSAVAAVLVLGYIGLHQSDILDKDLHKPVMNMPSTEVIQRTHDGTKLKHIDRDKIIPDTGESEPVGNIELQATKIENEEAPAEQSVQSEQSEQSEQSVQSVQSVQEPEEPSVSKTAQSAVLDEESAKPGDDGQKNEVLSGASVVLDADKVRGYGQRQTDNEAEGGVRSDDLSDAKVLHAPQETISAAPRAPHPTKEEQPPPPPPAPPMLPPPPAPKIAPAEASTGDENYKRGAQEYITTEGDHPAAATVQPTEDSRLFGSDDASELIAQELTHWRARRDTLLELSKSSSSRHVLDTLNASSKKDEILKGLSSELSNLRPQATEAGRRRQIDTLSVGGLQPLMVEAWFNVCRLTADSLERDDGIRYLRSVADDTTSSEAARAQEYLKRLGL